MLKATYQSRQNLVGNSQKVYLLISKVFFGCFVAFLGLFFVVAQAQVSSIPSSSGASIPRLGGGAAVPRSEAPRGFNQSVGYFLEMCGNPSHAIGLMERELFRSMISKERQAQAAANTSQQVGASTGSSFSGDAGVPNPSRTTVLDSLEALERADLQVLEGPEYRNSRIHYLERLNGFVARRNDHIPTLSELWNRQNGVFPLGLALSGGLLSFPEIVYIWNQFGSGDFNVLQSRPAAGSVATERVRDLTSQQTNIMMEQIMRAYTSNGGLFVGPYSLNGNNCLCFVLGSGASESGVESSSFFSLTRNPSQFRYTQDNWCAHIRSRLQSSTHQQINSLRSVPMRSARSLEALDRVYMLNIRIHTPQPQQLAQTLGSPEERARVVDGELVSSLATAFFNGGEQERDETDGSSVEVGTARGAGVPVGATNTTTTGSGSPSIPAVVDPLEDVLNPMRYVREK